MGEGRGRRGGPFGFRPGAPSRDAPSELVVARSSANAVELVWKDNATGERGIIVQRRVAAANNQFRTVMWLPGENLTSAIDKRIEPGRTYHYRVFALKPTPRGPVSTGVSNVVVVRVRE